MAWLGDVRRGMARRGKARQGKVFNFTKEANMQGWYRVKQAAQYCDISERTLSEWLRMGLRRAKVGGCVLIKREWLDEFIEKSEVESEAARVDKFVNEIVRELKEVGPRNVSRHKRVKECK